MDDTLMRIRALQAKAAFMQARIDACDGHLWKADYVSKIDALTGSSAVCVRCGERRGWNKIGPDEKWQYDTK